MNFIFAQDMIARQGKYLFEMEDRESVMDRGVFRVNILVD